MQNTEQFRALLSSPLHIVVTAHHKPDADALGSSLALSRYLQKQGHSVSVIMPSDYPRFLNWMSGNAGVLTWNDNNQEPIKKLIADAELIFILDCSQMKRIEALEPFVKESKATLAVIDHHLDPHDLTPYLFWNPKASSTAELVFDFIENLGHRQLMDVEIGECIYAGIMTDTGSFRFPATTSKVHCIIAKLIDLGVNNSKIHRLVYDNNSEERLRFLGFALGQKLKVLSEYGVAYFSINAQELSHYHSRTGDTEGLVNYALSIEGIVMACIFIEREDGVKISFRSAGDFSVKDFAFKHFSGGGHKNASGGRSDVSLAETEKLFLQLLENYKSELVANIAKEKLL